MYWLADSFIVGWLSHSAWLFIQLAYLKKSDDSWEMYTAPSNTINNADHGLLLITLHNVVFFPTWRIHVFIKCTFNLVFLKSYSKEWLSSSCHQKEKTVSTERTKKCRCLQRIIYLSETLYYAYYIFFANMISFLAADSNTCPGKYVLIKPLILLK